MEEARAEPAQYLLIVVVSLSVGVEREERQVELEPVISVWGLGRGQGDH